MARIQLSEGPQIAPGQTPAPNARASNARGGEIVGQQLQQQGAAVERAGQVMGQIAQDKLEQVNATRVTEALTRAQQLAMQQQLDYSQRRGANAMPTAEGLDGKPLAEVYGSKFDSALPEIARDLGLNEYQTEQFRQKSVPLALTFRANAASHERKEADVYGEAVYKTAIEVNTQEALLNADNPEALDFTLGQIRDATITEARRTGADEGTAIQSVRANTSAALLNVVKARADENPLMARDFRDKYAAKMLPSDVEAANDLINPAVGQMEVESAVGAFLNAGPAPAQPAAESGSDAPAPHGPARLTTPLANMPAPSSGYGRRESFRTANGARSSSNHDGLDLPAAASTPVFAQGAGRVVRAGPNGGYGNFVEVDYGGGLVLGYGHLQGFNVKEGDVVSPGQTFARVGSTGNSTGAHLHVRGRLNGRSIDPLQYLQGGASAPRPATARPTDNRPSRADAEAWASERYGTNPMLLRSARQEISRQFSMLNQQEEELKKTALEDAYRTIDAGGTPTATQLDAVRRYAPGSINSLNNYREARDAPPARKDDEATVLALIANPDAYKNMTPQEFVGTYGRQMTAGTLRSFVSSIATANGAARAEAGKADIVPADAFGQSFRRVAGLAGVNTPGGNSPRAQEAQQDLARLRETAWQRVLAKQAQLGRQMTQPEIDADMNEVFGQLQWQNGRRRGVTTSFETMQQGDRSWAREQLQARGVQRPDDDQIYLYYLQNRLLR